MTAERLIVQQSTWKQALGALGTTIFFVIGVALLFSDGPGRISPEVTRLIGAFCALIAGAGLAIFLKRLVKPSRLVLTTLCFSVEDWPRKPKTVPWTSVQEFHTVKHWLLFSPSLRLSFVAWRLADPFSHRSHLLRHGWELSPAELLAMMQSWHQRHAGALHQ